MRKAELKGYEDRLLKMSERLRGTVEELDREIAEERSGAGDLARVGTHNADRDTEFLEVDEASERNEVAILGDVEAALARIEKGTFGICERCGKPIPAKRLEALPYAACCSACAAT
ncbi:MAG TPA: TraR/DksA C4-type zinc finger protein [Planctomycetota bacterium]|nr:TraR/DksA C4-type zinc finger protein [Planctomycetota bacterium]